MGEENVLVVVSVPVPFKYRRDFIGYKFALEALGVGDVFVAENTTVLRNLLVVRGEKKMCLVVITEIAAIQGEVEKCGVLCLIVAAPVKIVELEAATQTLVGIDGKLRGDVVFTFGLVAAFVIGDVGDWRERIGEMKVLYGREEIVVRLCEDK